MKNPNRQDILGIPFFIGTVDEAIEHTLAGSVVVAPSGPNLAKEYLTVPAYRKAVQLADVVLTDSTLMVKGFRLVSGIRVPRISGLKFLRALLEREHLKAPGRLLWIMPSEKGAEEISNWLRSQGYPIEARNIYVAPQYSLGAIEDEVLLKRVQDMQPELVVINLAGGKQEVLGTWLKSQLGRGLPGIVCTGAAVAFLAGAQAYIPTWGDRAGLGWLFRCISHPCKFVPRYLRALPLLMMIWRYRDRAPSIRLTWRSRNQKVAKKCDSE